MVAAGVKIALAVGPARARFDDPVSADLFPDLPAEQAHLRFARQCRDRMVARLSAVDPDASADEITKEYIEVTVAEALEDLATPGAGDFFGRIDVADHRRDADLERWYIGRRHIENDAHDPVVVDWRAPIAAPFYRATGVDPLGLSHRRRFTLEQGDLVAYLDERLDDPDAASAAAGIPDPVLAEIGAARTGAMREIVATIQGEQDVVIRAPIDQCLVVQGGPGTGKTAVGLHRAAYLLFEHRRRLVRDGVLVVGPNSVFLDYIANVLPSLGERTVRQATVLDLCVPKVDIAAVDAVPDAAWKGDAARLDDLAALTVTGVARPTQPLRCAAGARTLTFTVDDINGWIDAALDSKQPVNKRRAALKVIVEQDLQRRTGREGMWAELAELRALIARLWPVQQPKKLVDRWLPGVSGKRRAWTAADQLLVDETNSLLNGTPFTYGHVVVDEAQDHSAVALRAIGRRSPKGSLTVLGDLAQSSTPAGQRDWGVALGHLGVESSSVAELTIGYRVPAPILDRANLLLPLTGVATTASRSVRDVGEPPSLRLAATHQLAAAAVEELRVVRHRHHNAGIVAPAELHDELGHALAAAGLRRSAQVQHLAADEVPVFTAEAVKGLEFDGVVVVNPHQILGDDTRGARLLYVAMTRAVQVLRFVSDAPLPPVLA
jgi:DNA helicase IV